MSQLSQIRAHLKKGRKLTAIDALKKFNCFRLAARVESLRQEGMDITTRMVNRSGKVFAEYSLAK